VQRSWRRPPPDPRADNQLGPMGPEPRRSCLAQRFAGGGAKLAAVAALEEILAELDRLLEPSAFADYCPNGLQVPGAEEVTKVASAVSAHAALFEQAVEQGVDALLVHHGLFWRSGPLVVDRPLKRRLELLFNGGISLLAYHLPLDAHPEFGNNALICRALGGVRLEPFAEHRGRPIGYLADLRQGGTPAPELAERLAELCSREPLHLDYGPPQVDRIAVVSGAGSSYLEEAIARGAKAFITGEPAERVMAISAEARVHFFAAGHYATETFGVRALGEHLAAKFGLQHQFLDFPNPI